jgi:hypothetical protein
MLSAQSGIMFFPNLTRLKSKPDGQRDCVANYSPDRILFHIENAVDEVVAVVSSSHVLAFTFSVLKITLSSSSSVSVSVK